MNECIRPTKDVLKRIQALIRELEKPMQKGNICTGCLIDKSRCPVCNPFTTPTETDCPIPFFQTGWFSYRSEKFGN